MTTRFLNNDAPHYKWFRLEQGRFLKEARSKTKFSQDDVSKHLGFSIGDIESGKSSLPMSDLARLVNLYRVSIEDFMMWQFHVGNTVRQMIAEP